MSDNEAKDKPSEKVTLCNSKFQLGEPWPDDMFGEVETQMAQIQASAAQQPGAQAKGAAAPVPPSETMIDRFVGSHEWRQGPSVIPSCYGTQF